MRSSGDVYRCLGTCGWHHRGRCIDLSVGGRRHRRCIENGRSGRVGGGRGVDSRRRRRHRGRRHRQWFVLGGLIVGPGQGTPKITDPLAKRTTDLRESLRPEDQERDEEDEDQVGWLKNVANHWTRA